MNEPRLPTNGHDHGGHDHGEGAREASDRVVALWDEIWDLLETGRSDEAATAALRGLGEVGEIPEMRFLLGVALLEMDEATASSTELERATELDPSWAQAHEALAWARFRNCDFEGAADAVMGALELDPDLADAHQLRGLLAERAGDDALADEAFADAHRLDPERYGESIELEEEEFLEIAQEAVGELDKEIREVLEDTAFFVQPIPSDELLKDSDPPLDPQLLGLFAGHNLLERTVHDSGRLPNTMYLFQRNLERAVSSREELEEEIRITVLHEIGHHLGWDEEELEERGLA
jgi:predicted Zn-dependent protease with MMP-like domain